MIIIIIIIIFQFLQAEAQGRAIHSYPTPPLFPIPTKPCVVSVGIKHHKTKGLVHRLC